MSFNDHATEIAIQKMQANPGLDFRDALLSITPAELAGLEKSNPDDFTVSDDRLHRRFAKAADDTARHAVVALAHERMAENGMSYRDALLSITKSDIDTHYRAAYKLQIEKAMGQPTHPAADLTGRLSTLEAQSKLISKRLDDLNV